MESIKTLAGPTGANLHLRALRAAVSHASRPPRRAPLAGQADPVPSMFGATAPRLAARTSGTLRNDVVWPVRHLGADLSAESRQSSRERKNRSVPRLSPRADTNTRDSVVHVRRPQRILRIPEELVRGLTMRTHAAQRSATTVHGGWIISQESSFRQQEVKRSSRLLVTMLGGNGGGIGLGAVQRKATV